MLVLCDNKIFVQDLFRKKYTNLQRVLFLDMGLSQYVPICTWKVKVREKIIILSIFNRKGHVTDLMQTAFYVMYSLCHFGAMFTVFSKATGLLHLSEMHVLIHIYIYI